MDPRQQEAALLEAQREAEYRARAALQRQNEATVEVQRQRGIQHQFEARRLALLERAAAAEPRHPPRVLPWKPTADCVQSPGDGGGYGYEERAKAVCGLLCEYVWSLRKLVPDPLFSTVVRQVSLATYETTPPNPHAISMTVDGAVIYMGGQPYIWISVEAGDFDEGAKYFRCWRNRQAVFPLLKVDGTLRPSLTWKDISTQLLFNPLHSRCHASPCELGWGPQELQTLSIMIQNERPH